MLKASKAVTTLEIQGARTYFVILFSGEMVKELSSFGMFVTPKKHKHMKMFNKCKYVQNYIYI